MAHIQKLKAHAMGQIFSHINRDRSTIERYGNKDIDSSKTHLNYDIIHGDLEKIQVRLSEVKHQKRDDLVTLCACVVTLPRNLKDSPKEDQKKFFNTVTEFMKQKFGENNVIYATVHEDESTPHLHIGFVPVAKIERKYRSKAKQGQTYTEERISAKAVVNRNMLKSFHTELDQYVEKYFQKCEILNGALKNRQNISISELKQRTAKKLEVIEKSYNLKKEFLNNLEETTGAIGQDFGLFVTLSKKKAINLINSSVGVKEMKSYLTKIDKLNQDYLNSIDGKKYLEVSEELKNYKEKNKVLEVENNELKKQMSSFSSLILENRKLKNENELLKDLLALAKNVIYYSSKVLENIRSYDFNSNALSSCLDKIKEFCFKNKLSIFNFNSNSRSRSR